MSSIKKRFLTPVLFLLFLSVHFCTLCEDNINLQTQIFNSLDGSIECQVTGVNIPLSLATGFKLRILNRSGKARDIVVTGMKYRKEITVPPQKTIIEYVYPPVRASNFDTYYYDILKVQLDDKGDFTFFSAARSHSEYKVLTISDPETLKQIPLTMLIGVPGIIINIDVWEKMQADSRQVLLDWNELGGCLRLQYDKVNTFSGIVAEENRFQKENPIRSPFFFGVRQFEMASKSSGSYNVIVESGLPAEWTITGQIQKKYDLQFNALELPMFRHIWLQDYIRTKAVNSDAHWDSIEIKRNLFLPLVILTGILIGPGVYFFCKRKKKPVLVLFLIPAFSILCCLFLLVFALFSDGIQPHVRFRSLTLLDRDAGKARVYSFVGIEAPMGIFEPFTIPEDTLLFFYDNSSFFTASHGKLNLASLVKPRVPLFFSMFKCISVSERIAVREENGQIWATNGLGCALKSLRVYDSAGRCLFAPGRVEAGEQVRLTDIPPVGVRSFCSGFSKLAYGGAKLFSPGKPAPRMFQAELEKNLFADFTLKHVREDAESGHIVLGTY